MNQAVAEWLDELSVVPNMSDHVMGPLRESFHALYREGDDNPHAAELFDGIVWIAAHRDKTPVERLEQMMRLSELDGQFILDMQEFTKW
jgi:hypothetical protein